MGRPDRANPDTENDACRRPSQSQAPAMRRPARTAKPQGRIPEHEASFQTRGPHRSRRRREQERRISRPNQKIRSAGMGAPQCTLPGLWGRGWDAAHLRASGADLRRAARSAVALEAWRASARHFAVGAAGRRSRARPAALSEAAHSTLVVVPDARIDRIRQDDRHDLVCVSADHRERPDCDVQIVPPMLLQFAVRVKCPRVRRNVTRRRHPLPLLDADCRNATMTRFDSEGRTRRKTGRHDRDALNYA